MIRWNGQPLEWEERHAMEVRSAIRAVARTGIAGGAFAGVLIGLVAGLLLAGGLR